MLLSLTKSVINAWPNMVLLSQSQLLKAKLILSTSRFVSRVEEVLNDWKLIGNSTGNLVPEKVFCSNEALNIQRNNTNEQCATSRFFAYTLLWYYIIWTQGAYTSGTWGEKSQDINFADFKFYITHYFLKQECEKDDGKDKFEEGTAIPQCTIKCKLTWCSKWQCFSNCILT